MKRRDFLLFRRTRHARIIEIPCERIYMHYLGAPVTRPRARDGAARGDGAPQATEPGCGAEPHVSDEPRDESMPGEPAPEFAERTTRDVLGTLDARLKDVDVVRVIDRHWLAADELSREFDAFLAAFIARGGRVEFVDGAENGSS